MPPIPSSSSAPVRAQAAARIVRVWPWIAILAVSVFLRVLHLGREAIWTDEYLTLMTASKLDLASFWANLRAHDPHPPLYFFMMYGWVHFGAAGDAALRIPSVVFGAATPFLFYAMLRALFADRRIAICGGLLMAISPMAIWYSQEARPYALLLAFETAAFAALAWDWKRSGRHTGPLGGTAAALAVLALWTHFFGGLVWAVVFVCLAARKFIPDGNPGVARPAKSNPAWLASLALLLLGAAWPAFAALSTLRSGAGIDWLPKSYTSRLWINVMQAQWLGPWFSPILPVLQNAAILGAAVLMIAGIWSLAQRGSREFRTASAPWILATGLLLLFILPVVVSFWRPIIFYGQRYMIIALPAVLALGSAGVFCGPRAWRWFASFLLISLVAAQSAYLAVYFSHRHKMVWDRAADWLAQHSKADDAVYVYPPYVAGLLERYLPEGRHAAPLFDWNQAAQAVRAAPDGCWIAAYGDLRSWAGASGFELAGPIGDFETTYPPTELWLTRLKPKPAP